MDHHILLQTRCFLLWHLYQKKWDIYELYHDDKNVATTMSFYCHDITPEKARKHFEHNRIMYVGEEHFIKKSEVV